ncbi:MAG: hypothetical protein HW416_1842 [Chloroflexi bacterium]|nr:hypothetical protein [Chloroflexota bacterium]
MDSLSRNFAALLMAIEDCLEKRYILPALVLLYTGIDVIAFLERQPSEGVRSSFTRWTEDYLLRAKPLPCTADELYAARCGVLHTFTADSDLSRRSKLRRIYYAWGTAAAKDLQRTSHVLGRQATVAVHISDLVEALRLGLAQYLDLLDREPTRQRIVAAAAGAWFVSTPKELVAEFLTLVDSGAIKPGPTVTGVAVWATLSSAASRMNSATRLPCSAAHSATLSKSSRANATDTAARVLSTGPRASAASKSHCSSRCSSSSDRSFGLVIGDVPLECRAPSLTAWPARTTAAA